MTERSGFQEVMRTSETSWCVQVIVVDGQNLRWWRSKGCLPGWQWGSACCQGLAWTTKMPELVFCTAPPFLSIRTRVVSHDWRGWSALALAVEKCGWLNIFSSAQFKNYLCPLFPTFDCCSNRPGVFSRVKCFVRWIRAVQRKIVSCTYVWFLWSPGQSNTLKC